MATPSFKELILWQKAILLTKDIYLHTENFPKTEVFGLRSQIRRASVSVASNIAEGRYRGTRKDFAQFLRIAYGSCAEVNTQIIISKELSFIEEKNYNTLIAKVEEISKILNVMIKKLSSPL